MKKTYVYFLIPLVGMIIFGAIYWNFSSGYAAREEARAVAERKAKTDKLLKEQADREKAIKDALAAQEVRKKQREEKEKKDQKDRDDRQAAEDARAKAIREAARMSQQVERITKEVNAVKQELAEIEEEKKKAIEEEKFLREYVKKAEDNRKSLTAVMERIQAADAAAEAAAKAAAAAAQKK